jgi:hypothetical protein
MRQRLLVLVLACLAILVVAIVASVPVVSSDRPLGRSAERSHDDDDDDETEAPFDEASLFLELNHTDGDLGIHALVDGDAWRQLDIESPDEREKLRVATRGSLARHGLTELFFESDEPRFPDEITLDRFFARFPAGDWEISGITTEGDELESVVELSHVLAAPPGNVMVNDQIAAENCDAPELPVVTAPVTISWDMVTQSHPTVGETGTIEVVKYQLVAEREEPELLVFSVDLPPDTTSFELPEDFTDFGEAFKFEIIVRTDTGNQTAVESCFEIE